MLERWCLCVKVDQRAVADCRVLCPLLIVGEEAVMNSSCIVDHIGKALDKPLRLGITVTCQLDQAQRDWLARAVKLLS